MHVLGELLQEHVRLRQHEKRRAGLPSTLKIRLPSGSRRTCGEALAVARGASTPLPMLAPSTRPSATVTGSSADDASVGDQQHDRQARVRQHGEHGADEDVEDHVVGQRHEQRAHRRRLGERPGRADDQLERERDQAEADQHPADAPKLLSWREMKKMTPKKMRSGESHERSSENTTAIRLVPTSAPSITASAALVVTRFLPTKEATIRQVAVLDCRMLVTPRPARSGAKAVGRSRGEDPAQVLAEDAQHAGAHDVRAPDEKGDRGEQVEKRQHRSGRRLPQLPRAANRSSGS